MIREMTKKDLNKVGELYKEANKFTSKKKILEWTKRNMKAFPNYHLVVCKTNKILGAISGKLISKALASIEDIAVDKKYRKKNIGGKLIKEIVNRFKKAKIKKIQLWVHWTDARAIPFYYKHNFRIIRFERTKNKKDVPNGEDIIILERDIN